MMKIGILREGKVPPDERVALTPGQIKQISKDHPNLEIVVKRSDIRRIKDVEYEDAGVQLVDNVQDCDILIGVKEVPLSELIPKKTYFFFSHTIKMQPYNKELLQTVCDQGITLIDWECLTAQNGNRIIGFGRYAGIVGTYNGLRAYGLKHKSFDLKKAHDCADREELEKELLNVKLPAIKILLSGGGKVAHGALEVLESLKIREIGIEDYLRQTYDEPVFCRIDFSDYLVRRDGNAFDTKAYYANPEDHVSYFMRFAKVTNAFIAGHYWDSRAPFLFTREDVRSPDFKIQLVADISCDIDGPVATTLRPSTIEDPFYGYDPMNELETTFDAPGAITVMAVDNLPCELPRDASKDFGEMFIGGVLPALVNGDADGILAGGSITRNGEIAEQFSYLKEWLAS